MTILLKSRHEIILRWCESYQQKDENLKVILHLSYFRSEDECYFFIKELILKQNVNRVNHVKTLKRIKNNNETWKIYFLYDWHTSLKFDWFAGF